MGHGLLLMTCFPDMGKVLNSFFNPENRPLYDLLLYNITNILNIMSTNLPKQANYELCYLHVKIGHNDI